MRNVNTVILIGNVTRDPEIRRTLNEQYVTTFGLATNRAWMTKDGRREQSTEFHEIVCWGSLAEIASQRIKKGYLVHVEGYLKTRSWDDRAGLKRFRTEIVTENLIVLERLPRISAHADETSEETEEREHPSITIEDPLTL